MAEPSIMHNTFVLERTYQKTPTRSSPRWGTQPRNADGLPRASVTTSTSSIWISELAAVSGRPSASKLGRLSLGPHMVATTSISILWMVAAW